MLSIGRFFILLLLLLPIALPAQVDQKKLKEHLTVGNTATPNKNLLGFYQMRDYAPVWLGKKGRLACDSLVSLLLKADTYGLNVDHYNIPFVKSAIGQTMLSTMDSVSTEITISTIALHFIRDAIYGNKPPAFRHDGLQYDPGCFNIPFILNNCLIKNEWNLLSASTGFHLPEIKIISGRINLLHDRLNLAAVQEETITSTKVSNRNTALCKKLFLLGITDTLVKTGTEKEISHYLVKAQIQFGLLADGTFRSTLLRELNVPVSARLNQLKLAMNNYRWLACLVQREPVIVVNIPAAWLKVYYQDSILTEMKMVVGKPSTPTPTLTSRVNEVILYPYWTVPRSIATKELLPSIKRNPGFLAANNFQLITSKGKIANPYQINWSSITASNFPYTIRQSTGCDNALGLIKLNFYSPFGVYLHDTPNKIPFTFNKRFFSHGCMRMEKPMELGHLILANNAIAIDTLEEKGCLLHQSPVVVPADIKMPVVVWYNPVGINHEGTLIYYEDVYRKLLK